MNKTKSVPVEHGMKNTHGPMYSWVYAQGVTQHGLAHPKQLFQGVTERPSWSGLERGQTIKTNGSLSPLNGLLPTDQISKQQLWQCLNDDEKQFFKDLNSKFGSTLEYAYRKGTDK